MTSSYRSDGFQLNNFMTCATQLYNVVYRCITNVVSVIIQTTDSDTDGEDEGGNIEIIPKGSSSDNNSNTGSSSSEVFQEHVLPGNL